MKSLICFLIFLKFSLGQVTETPRDQPLLQGTDVTRNCCRFLSDESKLLNCANQSAFQHLSSSNPSLAVVSYSTEGILGYGAYSMAINTYFAQLHGYGMNLLTPGRGAQYEPRDQRWNKVKILIDALDPITGWARDVQFIVWLDSDLIVLDMGLKLEDVAYENPSYDMIFSADGDIQNGIVNSGCFIVRNSPWSRAFLESWWSSYDRVTGMDQHIFTRVWEQTPNIADHILVLRPDALNSHLPAWVNQKDFNQILHLAGASNVLRKLVFFKGFQEICHSLDSLATRLPRQLGLDRQELVLQEKNLPIGAVSGQILSEMKSKSGKQIPLSEVKKLYSKILDLLQMGFERSENDPEVAGNILDGLRWSIEMFTDLSVRDAIGSYDHVDATQMALDSIFNLVMRLGQNSDAGHQQLLRATPLIDELLKIVRPEHYGPALYYKFKQRHFLGLYLEEQGDLLAALERYKEAVLVWWEMHKLKSYGSGNGAHDPYAEGCGILYDIAALSYSHQDFETCLESIHHILQFYKEVWGLRSQIPQPVLKKHALHLGIGGSCAVSNGNDSLALKYLSEALSIFKQMPEEPQYITQTESMVEELLQRKERNKKARETPEEEISITGEALRSPNRRVHRRKKKQ